MFPWLKRMICYIFFSSSGFVLFFVRFFLCGQRQVTARTTRVRGVGGREGGSFICLSPLCCPRRDPQESRSCLKSQSTTRSTQAKKRQSQLLARTPAYFTHPLASPHTAACRVGTEGGFCCVQLCVLWVGVCVCVCAYESFVRPAVVTSGWDTSRKQSVSNAVLRILLVAVERADVAGEAQGLLCEGVAGLMQWGREGNRTKKK